MPVPEFVLQLREKVGTRPLWLSGITAVITDDDTERILLIRRSDTGEWAPVTGIIDPGEQPAVAAAREALEEADVVIRVERLAGVNVTAPVLYPNGDRAQYLDLIFLCHHLSGDPRPADGEALEAAWFPLAALPPMTEDFLERIRHALDPGAAYFSIADAPRSW